MTYAELKILEHNRRSNGYDYGWVIRQIMAREGLSRDDIAHCLGVSPAAVSSWTAPPLYSWARPPKRLHVLAVWAMTQGRG